MAYQMTQDCIACGSCESACSMEAIAESNGQYRINAELCVECGACVDACPNDAIELDG